MKLEKGEWVLISNEIINFPDYATPTIVPEMMEHAGKFCKVDNDHYDYDWYKLDDGFWYHRNWLIKLQPHNKDTVFEAYLKKEITVFEHDEIVYCIDDLDGYLDFIKEHDDVPF